MKLGLTGFLFELDVVPFRVGAIIQVTVTLPFTEYLLVEKVRSIKHYDKFYRRPPKKNSRGIPEGPEEKPKKLIEVHFLQLKSENRMAIERYFMALSVDNMKRENK